MLKIFLNFLKPPTFPYDEEKTRRAHALNALLINMLTAMVVLGGLGILFIFKEKIITSTIIFTATLVVITGIILNRRGKVNFAANILLLAFWILTIVMTSLSGGIHSLDILFFISGTVIAGITLGVRGSFFYAILSLITGLGMIILENNGFVFPQIFPLPPVSAWVILFINLVFTVLPLQVTLQSLSDSAARAHSSEERFRLIASVISDYAYQILFDENEKPTEQWTHGAFEAITGYTPDEFFNRGGWTSILHPLDHEQDRKDMELLRANQKVITEVRLIRKDGEIKWVRSYANPIWNDKLHKLAGIYGAVQDITENKRVEKNLFQRESILDAVAISAEKLLKTVNWKDELNSILEVLGKSINASHAYFFENQMKADGRIFTTMVNEWTAPGFKSELGDPKYTDIYVRENDLESWYETMKQGLPYIGDKTHLDENDHEFLVSRDIFAIVDVPIFINDQWQGSIGFDDMALVREWTNAEVDALKVAGNVLSAAIKRQQDESILQEELNKRKLLIAELEHRNAISETLHESAAIVVATLNQSEAITGILEQLEKVVYFDSASVQLIKGNMLEIVSGRGLDINAAGFVKRFELNENEPSYRVIVGEIPYLLTDDVQVSIPAFNEIPHDNIHAWMVVPLKVKGEIIGIIAMDGKTIAQFTQADAKLASTYANQVAIAITNSRLYNEVQVELKVRQNLIEELEAKNAELERFTYTVSHDLRSPLVTIKGYLGYIEKNANQGNLTTLLKDIQRVNNATDRMEILLKDLLELSRVGRLVNKSQEMPFEDIIREAEEIVRGRLEQKGITLHTHRGLPAIYGDKPRLVEVMQNLIDNAAKYMGSQQDPVIEIGVNEINESGTPIFFIRDNGMGIDPAYHELVFGLFEKLDASSEGTGIGLALVKRIIEFHGGRIWVESELGKGIDLLFHIAG